MKVVKVRRSRRSSLLRRTRLLRDQTQGEVASALGIDPSYYSRIESGKVACTPELARKLEEHFGHAISRMQILYPEDYPAAPPQAQPTSRSP